jgi:hypothetical protein
MKKAVLLLCVLSSCCGHHEGESNVLYDGQKCVIIRVNDSTLVIAPGINSAKDAQAQVVFLGKSN